MSYLCRSLIYPFVTSHTWFLCFGNHHNMKVLAFENTHSYLYLRSINHSPIWFCITFRKYYLIEYTILCLTIFLVYRWLDHYLFCLWHCLVWISANWDCLKVVNGFTLFSSNAKYIVVKKRIYFCYIIFYCHL